MSEGAEFADIEEIKRNFGDVYELYSIKEGIVYSLNNALIKEYNGYFVLTDLNGDPLALRKR